MPASGPAFGGAMVSIEKAVRICGKWEVRRLRGGLNKKATRGQKKRPGTLFPKCRAQYWQRPTLAQPIDALPSALQRFTSVFGMGTGGATARDHQTMMIRCPESPGVWRHPAFCRIKEQFFAPATGTGTA